MPRSLLKAPGLRQKLEADPQQPSLIQTEQGVGYRLRAAD